jgi:type II secretory pathway pseudopilin PulG
MSLTPLKSSSGFTYIAALVMVVIMGIMGSQASQIWVTRMQREREVELIFRGTQVRDALRRWYSCKIVDGKEAPLPPGTAKRGSPPELKALVNGSDGPAKAHFLRPSNLIDPITGKDWGLVKDAGQRIIGVASTSEAAPLKQDNFPFELHPDDFKAKKKYSDWQFIYNRIAPPYATGAQPIKPPTGSTTSTTSSTTGTTTR